MSARAQANHSLYLARILVGAWRSDLEKERVPTSTLAQAYEPAVQLHLTRAYGWFLLEILQTKPLPNSPPVSCDELPTVAVGKVTPGEIREFQQLEQSGWLADMLAPAGPATRAGNSSPSNLAVSAMPGPERGEHWASQLEALFERMADSLDEY